MRQQYFEVPTKTRRKPHWLKTDGVHVVEGKKRFHSVSLQLLVGVLLISSVLTVLTSAYELYSDYNRDLSDLDKRMALIEVSYLDTLAYGMWNYNDDQINIGLQSLLNLPDVAFVQIQDPNKIAYSKGEEPKDDFKKITYALKFNDGAQNVEIGHLHVYASLKGIYEKLLSKLILILISQTLKTFISALLILAFLNIWFTRHLHTIKVFFEKFDPGKAASEKLVLHRKERGYLDDFDYLIASCNEMIAMLNELLNNLESKIRERTQQLWEKSRDISSILQNMQQGVFTIKDDLTIDPEYSPHLEKILGTGKISGKSIVEMLIDQSKLNNSDRSTIRTILESAFGYDIVAFLSNSELLPRQIDLATDRNLEIDWSAIVDQQDQTEKILVTVRDVTEIQALRRQAEQQKRDMEIVEQVITMGVDAFKRFYLSAKAAMKENENLFATKTKSTEVLAKAFINLHTLKGLAKTYNLKALVPFIHNGEQYCSDLRADPTKAWDFIEIRTLHQAIEIELEYTMEIVQAKLLPLMKPSASGPGWVTKAEDLLNKLPRDATDAEKLDAVGMIIAWKNGERWTTLHDALSDEIKGVPAIANLLGKKPPRVALDVNNVLFDREIISTLKNIFVHLLRNSLDHGLEGAEERVKNGKPAAGKISIVVNPREAFIVMFFFDDGRGLALEHLARKGVEQRIIPDGASDQQIAETIFASGVTTAQALTDISGQGVGMDAVRSFVTKLGGEIKIEFTAGRSPTGFRPFRFVITIAGQYCNPGASKA